jgi:Ca2+-binding EF-hand superfamily protein
MDVRFLRRLCAAALLAVCATGAAVDDPAEYMRRLAERDTNAFKALDLNRDGVVTQDEAVHDLDFAPRFNDMDINRDGVITADELQRYLAWRHDENSPRATADNR